MKRLELFEFEDFAWLPTFIRSSVTKLIQVLHRMTGTSEVLASLILDVKKATPFDRVVDIGSGSGGPMIEAISVLNENKQDQPLQLMLTDKYPDSDTVSKINRLNIPNVVYFDKPIDASKLEESPKGLKTLIASFHHMKPSLARQILLSAQTNDEPILIYEIAKNTIPIIVWWLLLPISLLILVVMSLVMTPFVKSLTLKQVIFTYLIPIIPLVYAWDGQASIMRTYTFSDINSLIENDKNVHYKWKIADATKINGKKMGYYIMGLPNN